MARTNVWLNDTQVKQLQRELGKGVNISGCIRGGLELLLAQLRGPDGARTRVLTLEISHRESEIERLVAERDALKGPAPKRRRRS